MISLSFVAAMQIKAWHTGLTRINPRDVAAAAGTRSSASPRSPIPSPLQTSITMGSEPASSHIWTEALNCYCVSASSPAVTKTVPSIAFTTLKAAFAITKFSFFDLSLSDVSDPRSESRVLLFEPIWRGTRVRLRWSAVGAAASTTTNDIWRRWRKRAVYGWDHRQSVSRRLRGRKACRVSSDDSTFTR